MFGSAVWRMELSLTAVDLLEVNKQWSILNDSNRSSHPTSGDLFRRHTSSSKGSDQASHLSTGYMGPKSRK